MGDMTQNMKTKICVVCGKEYEKDPDSSYKLWNARRYCSQGCYRKIPRSEEVRNKIKEGCKRNGVGKWMMGRKRPEHLRIKHSEDIKKIVASGKHNFWKGGISKVNRTFKASFQNTIEFRLWRTAVFTRDNYTCVWCGSNKSGTLNADHIQEFALYPELRLAIDNGRTLCRECHYKRHSKPKLDLANYHPSP